MTTVEKIEIRGIRSFSPNVGSVICFSKPLCLIVGQNGAGKTTIIECLKQACTGDLPPNCRSGHSFIHDPKISGDHEVKAQIKLKLLPASGSPLVVVRSFQVKQTARNVQFKSLDASILARNRLKNKTESVSHKCAEVDRLVPSLMGVSKAILENVIFVHQEDSSWPLAEGAVLKKKFDDIFAATKYSKALEQLNKLLKEQRASVKEIKLQLANLRTIKDHAEKLRAEAVDHENNVALFQSQIEEAQKQIDEHQQAAEEANRKLREISRMAQSITDLQARHEEKHKQLAEMRARMGDEDTGTETLEELEQMMNEEVEMKLAAVRADIQATKHNLNLKTNELSMLKTAYADACKRQGKLLAEVDHLNALLRERDQYISHEGSKLSVEGLALNDGRLGDDQVAHGMRSIAALVAAKEKELLALKEKHRKADEELGAQMDAITAQLTACQEKQRLARGRKEQAERQAAALEARLGSMPSGQDAVADAERREEQAREALRRREEEAARNDHEAKLDELAVQIEDATRKTQRLRARRDQLAQSAESTARLRVKRQDLTAKEQHLKSLITGNRTAIEGALGVAPGVSVTQLPAGDVVRMLQQGLAEKKGEMDDVERRATGAAREAAVKESEVAARRGEVEKLEREERAIQRDLDGLMGGASGAPSQAASLDKKVEDLERELREEDEIQQVAGHLRTFWEKQQKKGRKNNACGVCLRAFRGDDDSAAFFSHCQAEVRKCVAIQEQDAGAREAQRRKLEAFKVAQPRWARLRELQLTALPEAREALGRAEEEARALRAAAESAEVAAEMARAEFAQADAVASGVGGEIERAERDLAALREEISELEARAGPRSGADDIEAVSRELDSEETRRATLEREREGVMRAQAAARDALQGVHNAWRDAKEELAGVRARVKEAEDLRARLSEAESERERAVEEETWLRSEEEPLGGRRTELQRERERRRGAAARSERSMEEAVGSVRSVLSRAQQACDLADSAARKGAAEELRRLEKEIARQKAGQAGAEKEVEDLREKLEALTQTDMQADAMRKEIQAVIDIKRAERDVSALGRQVQEALAEQAAIGDPRGLREEAEAAGGRLEKARRNRNLSEGALKTVQLQLNRTRESLRGAEYRNIDEKFRSKSVEERTADYCVGDLEKYTKALEKALLAFHGEKMEEINRTIKELWQRVYRNQDIDYIQIRAEADTTSAKRSYNYRVVMSAGGAELDMRGRCSAGQKVLACLIIRLALSETFGLNCGILALDEPTTNLDEANAKSLAEALRSLMEARRQTNFQLIVITHDENFAHAVGTRELVDHLWRVSKDENQHSIIEQEYI